MSSVLNKQTNKKQKEQKQSTTQIGVSAVDEGNSLQRLAAAAAAAAKF